KSMLGERLGHVTVTAEEPSPLIYVSGPLGASTDCVVNISIQGSVIDPDRLRTMTIEVHTTIHSKTYYSSKRMPCMPSRHLLTEQGPYLYETVVNLEVQKLRDFQWTFWPWAASRSLEKQEVTWQTVIRIPIRPSHRLYPSFCSQLIARSYSINLRICFGGAYIRKMDLEVPLQVAYPRISKSASQPEDGNLERLMEEDGVCLSESGIILSPNHVGSLAAA
ncbi:hypothetical protein BGZ61DRAFT_371489, partial [Ilyonectria robusta]|uniref:uncharacterized protein n=1 Tax=Ilyonectria robusta TaxID=1079257 RepID=UPI001E8DEC4F